MVMARSIGFSLSKSSSSNSCLARLIGFSSSKNSFPLIGKCYSLPITYSTTTTPTTESRRPTKQLPRLILASENTVYRFYSLWEKDVKKVVVQCSDPPPHADSRCFEQSKLAFCIRTRRADYDYPNLWITLHSFFMQYDQIIYHSGKKLFYTLTARGWTIELEAWDLHSDPINRFHIEDQSQVLRDSMHDWPPCMDEEDMFDSVLDSVESLNWDRRIHLVYDHQSQELFIVMRHVLEAHRKVLHIVNPDSITHKTMTFDVFKVDFINDNLMNLQYLKDSIGKHAFFVGKKWSFVLSTTEFPELRPDSIYFADDHYDWEHNFRGHDMGIYDYKEDSIIDKIESISPANSWFIPDVDTPDVDVDF
ncbi:hypothetical protein T459_17564 [Capsicum annuum]|uniref:KIB1-4 beta-propeller domain-containing protein n=1 Tax=Capsicum annuum TaxID=4072 RepID=A0A2G2ZBZ0_CAPAN|nr:hypothetical protein T459_17564 [Capsicum annuum]